MRLIRRGRRLQNSVAVQFFCLFAVAAYLFSYAPFVRIVAGPSPIRTPQMLQFSMDFGKPVDFADGTRFGFYRPVDGLIDDTPLGVPLLYWADLWGVGKEFRTATWYRKEVRSIPPSVHP